jgi:VIT1/CCC1 family predicted Fe2+/Mn2+ transporter
MRTAVLLTLVLSSVVSSRTGELLPRRMLVRTVIVGALTMMISFAAGQLLL